MERDLAAQYKHNFLTRGRQIKWMKEEDHEQKNETS